jgi:hypothetical protein
MRLSQRFRVCASRETRKKAMISREWCVSSLDTGEMYIGPLFVVRGLTTVGFDWDSPVVGYDESMGHGWGGEVFIVDDY